MFANIADKKGTSKYGAILWRRVALPLLLALLALGFVGGSTGFASSSAPLRPAVVSHQTADAAPAMIAFNGTAYVGWTGRNAAHNLNLMTYDTASQVFGTAQVLTDTTLVGAGPSLEIFDGNLYVAWLGTDHRLNVGRYNLADPTHLANKVTLSESSYNVPSMVAFNGRLYLSWRGTDGRLNIISSADAIHFDTKASYNIASRTSPTLVNAGMFLYVFWEDVSANSFIVVGSYDPSNPTQLSTVVTTTSTSQLPVGLTFAGTAGPVVRVAWRTASDAHIRLGLFGGDSALHNQVTTAQTTLYGPALTVAGRGGPFISWTGTDATQSVNVSPVNI